MIKTVHIAEDNNNTSNNNNLLGETGSSSKIVRIKSPIPQINMSSNEDKGMELTLSDLKDKDGESKDAVNEEQDKDRVDGRNNKNVKKISLKTVAKSTLATKKLSKTFKTFRSSNNLASSEKKMKFASSAVMKRDPNMTDEEAEADALVRTVIKTRRMKKILKAKLDSLRVQENIQFAIEHDLDAADLNIARADIDVACNRLTDRFETETGPLVNALKKVRRLHQDMQLIEDLETGGFRNVVEMLETQLNDLIDERNSKQYQIHYAHKILHEIEEDEQAAEELAQTNILNEKKTEHYSGQEGNFLTVMRAAKKKHKDDLLKEKHEQGDQDVPTKEDDVDGVAEAKLDDDDGYKIVTPKASRRILAGLT